MDVVLVGKGHVLTSFPLGFGVFLFLFFVF